MSIQIANILSVIKKFGKQLKKAVKYGKIAGEKCKKSTEEKYYV